MSCNKHNLFFVLIALSASWFYLEISVGNLILPNVFPFLFSLIYALFNPLKKKLYISFFLLILSIFIFSLLSGYFFSEFNELVLGLVQITTSLFTFFVLLDLSEKLSSDFMKRFVKFFLMLIIALMVLEVAGVTASLNNAIRFFLYDKSLYLSVERDVAQYGIVRPTLFTKEPAHLAFLYSTFASLHLILNKSAKFLSFLCLFLIGYFLIRSPVVMLVGITYVSLIILEQRNLKRQFIFFFAALFISILILYTFTFFFADRLSYIMSGEDFSATNRILGVPLVLNEVLSENLLFGVGLTNDPIIANYVSNVFIDLGFEWRVSQFEGDSISKRVTNYFAQFLIYFGLLGFTSVFFLIYKFLESYGGRKPAFSAIVLFFLFSLGMGGAVTVKVWALLAFIFIAFKNLFIFEVECEKGVNSGFVNNNTNL